MNEYCSSACACLSLNATLPDFIVEREILMESAGTSYEEFNELGCAAVEQCIAGLGARRLLRFSVSAKNQGNGMFRPLGPEDAPGSFFYSPCHDHFHYANYMAYSLLDPETKRAVTFGRKAGFCLEDVYRWKNSPMVSCAASTTCVDQGVSLGWADVYGSHLYVYCFFV